MRLLHPYPERRKRKVVGLDGGGLDRAAGQLLFGIGEASEGGRAEEAQLATTERWRLSRGGTARGAVESVQHQLSQELMATLHVGHLLLPVGTPKRIVTAGSQ